MNRTAYRSNVKKITVLALFVLLAAVAYMLVEVHFDSTKLFQYAMKIRTPKLIVMLITAFAIGGASIVFQSIINNTIVTPCLLGMNSLYTLIHTAVVFCRRVRQARSRPIANLSFAVDLLLMGVVATVVYSYLFQKDQPQRAVCAADRNGAFLLFFQYPEHHDPRYGPERVRRPVEHPGGQLQQHQF